MARGIRVVMKDPRMNLQEYATQLVAATAWPPYARVTVTPIYVKRGVSIEAAIGDLHLSEWVSTQKGLAPALESLWKRLTNSSNEHLAISIGRRVRKDIVQTGVASMADMRAFAEAGRKAMERASAKREDLRVALDAELTGNTRVAASIRRGIMRKR